MRDIDPRVAFKPGSAGGSMNVPPKVPAAGRRIFFLQLKLENVFRDVSR
jgi:hypothetical protein